MPGLSLHFVLGREHHLSIKQMPEKHLNRDGVTMVVRFDHARALEDMRG